MSNRDRLTPWQRIMRADRRSTGLRLSADDVGRLAADGAIVQRAALDDDHQLDDPRCGCEECEDHRERAREVTP